MSKMQKSPAFQFYARDFLADGKVQLMTCEEVGAYLLLLLHQWLEGSVPADTRTWHRICRVSPRRMKAMLGALEPCFSVDARGRKTNSRLEEIRQTQVAFSEAQSQRIQQRWHSAVSLRNESGNTGRIPDGYSASASAIKQHSPHKKHGESGARARVLPPDWKPNAGHEALAAELGLSVTGEAAQFRDHWAAKGKPMRDWDACFRTWLRNAVRFGGAPGPKAAQSPPSPPPQTTPEEYAAKAAERRKLLIFRDFFGPKTERDSAWNRATDPERKWLLEEASRKGLSAQYASYRIAPKAIAAAAGAGLELSAQSYNAPPARQDEQGHVDSLRAIPDYLLAAVRAAGAKL